eukprot:gnl/TRDRNA2_/TRDRNA2_32821_c0_seq1.p1 gnl/TRDRNA2_/TRDRNA2_32821_c0~~gnl/TRDRNA2_/TRDRNA2_32821_c0_seq1.p1  ORF type:complete len:606 (-),score=134.57 gnl/TRDRNA2_/TRDRNA2_32821_c0_seq1:136-1713(-)
MEEEEHVQEGEQTQAPAQISSPQISQVSPQISTEVSQASPQISQTSPQIIAEVHEVAQATPQKAATRETESAAVSSGKTWPRLQEDEVCELFACTICDDLLLDPVTLVCCGKSFCRGCLRQWLRISVHSAGVPRCPSGGCQQKMPFRLPSRNYTLQRAMEQLVPEQLKQREKEAADGDDEEEEAVLGGFRAWQEVAVQRDIHFGHEIGVRKGTSGILVGNFTDGRHVTVKFDEREDHSELCVNVLPEVLDEPLPGKLRLGMRIVTLCDLLLNGDTGISSRVPLGTEGTIVGRQMVGNEDRLMVVFEDRLEGGPRAVSVNFHEVQPQRPLVGGFMVGQQAQAAMDLVVGSKVVVRAGTQGTVMAEFSDTRLTVAFDEPVDGVPSCFNVLPVEIKPWHELPNDMPAGQPVKASMDLLNAATDNEVVIRAGTRGVVVGGVDDRQVIVSFENTEVPLRTCPQKHTLCQREGLRNASIVCGACNGRLCDAASLWGCRPCDFYLCGDCAKQDCAANRCLTVDLNSVVKIDY